MIHEMILNRFEKILKIWENHGVKNAIEEYQKNNNGMDKFGFIKQLLENEKFNSSQKERFLKLVTNEFANLNAVL